MPATKRKPPAAKPLPQTSRRLIVILPEALHRRIKVSCASRNIPMSVAIRETLEHASWPVLNA
jgi:hypothetical protein